MYVKESPKFREPPKEKDVGQIIRYLTSTFNSATSKMEKSVRNKNGPNRAYIIQSEFAYRLNELTMGPKCVLQKNIAECNDFIDEVVQEMSKS